jgi:hypothetical protein
MAWSVRRCKSVKTRRGFFGDGCSGGGGCSSLRLQTTATADKTQKKLSLVYYSIPFNSNVFLFAPNQ